MGNAAVFEKPAGLRSAKAGEVLFLLLAVVFFLLVVFIFLLLKNSCISLPVLFEVFS